MRIIPRILFLLFLLTFFSNHIYAQKAGHTYNVNKYKSSLIKFPIVIASPNNKLKLVFRIAQDGGITYIFIANSKTIIDKSKIGISDIGKPVPTSASRHSVNSVWKPVWGKRAIVSEKYNELSLDLKSYKIIARAYNDGIAFRYEFPEGNVNDDLTQFNFAGNYTAWYYNGEKHNIGPEKLLDCNGKRLPVMTIKVDDDNYIAIHEACLSQGEPMILQSKKGETLFNISSKLNNAWKVVMYGNKPGELVDSHIIELLNPPPSDNMDFSWVKPGLAVWDWRINGAQADSFKYEMSLPSWKRMVDFASANQIPYLVLDANWYGPEFGKDSDPVKGGKIAQVRDIIRYGKAKNVGIWLYLNDVGGQNYSIEQTLSNIAIGVLSG